MVLLESEILHDILDNMQWSFSRLNSFYTCKRMWYYTYIMKETGKDNFFSQYGSYAHTLFEKYNKGELELFQLCDFYDKNYYDFVTEEAPPNKYVDLGEKYYNNGREYFSNFNGYDDITVGAEIPFDFNIDVLGKERRFIGYIDRVSKDENGFIVTDYKSKSKFKNNEELKAYARQLYMYCIGVKKLYGEYPYKMQFNQFRENKIETILFDKNAMDETVDWIKNTIELIYKDINFDSNYNQFFCDNLCSIGTFKCME